MRARRFTNMRDKNRNPIATPEKIINAEDIKLHSNINPYAEDQMKARAEQMTNFLNWSLTFCEQTGTVSPSDIYLQTSQDMDI